MSEPTTESGGPVAQGWWHPSVKSGQVHDHSSKQPQSMHRLCEQVYLARSFEPKRNDDLAERIARANGSVRPTPPAVRTAFVMLALDLEIGADETDVADLVAELLSPGFAVRDVQVERRCSNCGCTNDDACDPPCSWVRDDLCSACEHERTEP